MATITGCVTLLKFIRGQSLSELEARLGFSSGALRNGAEVFRAIELPSFEGFECYGYTLQPTDILETDGQYDETKVRERFGNLDRMKVKELARSCWNTKGNDSLVKVRQLEWEKADYPRGTGVPQWKLNIPVAAERLATLLPGEPWVFHCLP